MEQDDKQHDPEQKESELQDDELKGYEKQDKRELSNFFNE